MYDLIIIGLFLAILWRVFTKESFQDYFVKSEIKYSTKDEYRKFISGFKDYQDRWSALHVQIDDLLEKLEKSESPCRDSDIVYAISLLPYGIDANRRICGMENVL
jgi:hypothetical protein